VALIGVPSRRGQARYAGTVRTAAE